MSEAKKYDRSYKEQSVKLAQETGVKRALEELKVLYGTLYGWVQAAKNGDLDIEERTPENAMSLAEEIRQLRSEVIVHSRCRYFTQVNHCFGEKVIRKMRLMIRMVYPPTNPTAKQIP